METVPTKQIVAGQYELSFTLVTETQEITPEALLHAQYEQNVSFSKVLVFIEKYFNYGVIFESDLESDTEIFDFLNQWDNNLIVVPDMHESTLIAAIHSKLNKIVSENTFIDKVSMTDKTQNITYHYVLTDDDEYTELPQITDWMGEFSYFENAWWDTADTRTLDRPAKDQEELDKWKTREQETDYFNVAMQPFVDIENDIKAIFKEMTGDESKSNKGELVELEEFKNKKSQDKKKWTPTVV